MFNQKQTNGNIFKIILFLILILIIAFFYSTNKNNPVTNETKNNFTEETVNNSSLNQVNNLEEITTNWKTFSDEKTGLSFKYPENLNTKYISVVDWPPVLNIYPETYSCLEAGSEIERAGKTEEVTENGENYCITTESEGAAGSVYKQYAVKRSNAGEVEIFTFSLRFVQCYNYDEKEQKECEEENNSFAILPTIHNIFQTIVRE